MAQAYACTTVPPVKQAEQTADDMLLHSGAISGLQESALPCLAQCRPLDMHSCLKIQADAGQTGLNVERCLRARYNLLEWSAHGQWLNDQRRDASCQSRYCCSSVPSSVNCGFSMIIWAGYNTCVPTFGGAPLDWAD